MLMIIFMMTVMGMIMVIFILMVTMLLILVIYRMPILTLRGHGSGATILLRNPV